MTTSNEPCRTAVEARGWSELTVVMPVFDEAPTLEAVVDEVLRELPGCTLLVLNDGSRDWSPELEQRLDARAGVVVENHYPNRGKGAMVDRSFRLLRTAVTVVLDADGEYAAADVRRVAAPILGGQADWVLGSRYGFDRPRPRQYRATYLVNRAINLWFRLLSGARTVDLLTGLFAIRSDLLVGMRLRENRFSYTAELAWNLRKSNARRLEVPVSYRFRTYAEGKKIRWWETATLLLALLRYRFRSPASA